MQIANPIYDVVFKYLMEDNTTAQLLLSSIIEEKIISLEFLPKERILHLDDLSLTVQRMDFSGRVETDSGEKQVIIEIQKAKFASDIIRFRNYLGEQYSHRVKIQKVNKDDVSEINPLPIISIYFLGHELEHITAPFIKVKRAYYDGISGEEIKEREEFIECLTHDSYVIQIPQLREEHKTEIEQLLSIFDQKNVTSSDIHILNIDPLEFPKKYQKIIRRLQKAIVEKEVRDIMDLEDEIIEDFKFEVRKAEIKGFKKGEVKGFEKGEVKGFEKGEKLKAITIAQKALIEGLEYKLISTMTGLTIEEIEKLEND